MTAKTFVPTPWRVGDAGHTVFGPPNGNPSPATVANVREPVDARRIVACVNALQGIANPETIAMAIGILRDIARFVSAGDDDVPFKVMLEDAKYALRALDGEQGQ